MSSLKTYYLKGKVKTIITKTYEIIPESGNSGIFSDTYELRFIEDEEYIFREDGNMVESCRCDAQGKMTSLHLFSYDDQGNLIEDSCYSRDGLHVKNVHLYNKKGLNVGKLEYIANLEILNVIYVFDKNGHMYSYESYNKDGVYCGRTVYDLDENGAEIGITDYSKDDSITQKVWSKVNADRVVTQRYMESYHSIITTSICYSKAFYQYDDNHNELECIRHFYFDNEEKTEEYKYEYEFDEHHNWIKKKEYKNGHLHKIHFRKIEYFES